MYGLIYRTINIVTNKSYVGQTTRISLFKKKAYLGSGSYLRLSINKYGISNFKSEILEYCEDQNKLNVLEQHYISKFNTLYPNGYNLKLGGDQGGKCIEETKVKLSLAKKGKPLSQATKSKLSTVGKINWQNSSRKESMSKRQMGKLNHFYGKSHSKESIEKISNKNKNKIIPLEVRDKISKSLKNSNKNSETRFKVGRISENRQKVALINDNGDILETYNTLGEATNKTGANNISGVCRGIYKSTKGLKFKYLDN